MSNEAKSTFTIENWDETVFSRSEEGPELIRVDVSKSFSGDIEGVGTLEYLMITYDETFTRFIGTERIDGKVGDRSGSFVINHEGTYEDGVAKGTCLIVPDSGVGDLSGIKGKGHYEATHEESEFTMEYGFE